MSRYELIRRREPRAQQRAVQYDEAKQFVYVYVRQSGWVDVFKFTRAQVVEAANAAALLEEHGPRYRVEAGACNCPGFEFRGKCRHTEHVRYLYESREGWRSARI